VIPHEKRNSLRGQAKERGIKIGFVPLSLRICPLDVIFYISLQAILINALAAAPSRPGYLPSLWNLPFVPPKWLLVVNFKVFRFHAL